MINTRKLTMYNPRTGVRVCCQQVSIQPHVSHSVSDVENHATRSQNGVEGNEKRDRLSLETSKVPSLNLGTRSGVKVWQR